MTDSQVKCFEYLYNNGIPEVYFEGRWRSKDDFRYDPPLAFRFARLMRL